MALVNHVSGRGFRHSAPGICFEMPDFSKLDVRFVKIIFLRHYILRARKMQKEVKRKKTKVSKKEALGNIKS